MRATRTAFTLAAALTVAAVVMGAVVCATESGAACPNWPGCYSDQFTPDVSLQPMIEFLHRVVSAVCGPAVLVAALLGRRLPDPRPRKLAWIGLAGTIAAGAFGMLIVKVGIPWWLGMVDLASALTATVSLMLARMLLLPSARWAPGPLATRAWAALGALTVLHLTALAVAGTNSFTRCLSWPLGILEADRWPLLQAARVGLAVLAAALIVVVVVGARTRPELRVAAGLAAGLLALELVLADVLLLGHGELAVRTVYAVVAALLFAAVSLLATRASVAVSRIDAEASPVAPRAAV